ncbi:hypothetical protein HYU95_01210 [Candidatus Daviesbacteria bacterium]|nr:hypothetical protein [Candidatus Daviesbacteria bacterium]
MSTQEILNIIFILGFLVITVCVALITYYLIQTLRAITALAQSLNDTTQDIKERIQNRFLTLIPGIFLALFSKLLKRR